MTTLNGFITLSTQRGNSLLLRHHLIEAVQRVGYGHTEIRLTNSDVKYHVSETPKEIADLIQKAMGWVDIEEQAKR